MSLQNQCTFLGSIETGSQMSISTPDKKIRWEKALQDPAELTRLAEWARTGGGNSSGSQTEAQPVSDVFDVEQPRHLEPITREIITANDRSTVGAPLFREIESFVPDLVGLSPIKALETLEARFKSDPSFDNGLLLQAAINRITTTTVSDSYHAQAVERAAQLFSVEDKKNSPPRTDDIWYKAYEHADFGGRSFFTDMTPGWGYWRQPDFGAIGMNDLISSIACNSSLNEVGGSVVLFEHARYFGRYQNYGLIPGRRLDIHYVGNDFNDITSSALIIRRFPKETRPVTLSSLVPQSAIADIVNATPRVRPAGDVIFTWDMWPTGGSSNDPHPNDIGRTFIYVNVPINVLTPWPFPDYYAQVRYWIYLYVDSTGKMQGYVAYWGYYVESGIISGTVAAGLRDAIPRTIPQVNSLIARALGVANLGSPYSYVYYLPGRFNVAGNVSDDVTIVAVRR
jgi:hypothetical protein